MTQWMLETLLWTAVLIAFVLLVRRPAARHFGPQIAYALWALPALRLFLPPIELPAWMRVSEPVLAEPTVQVVEAPPVTSTLAPLEETSVAAAPSTEVVSPLLAQPAAFDFSQLVTPALAVWLVGAAVFLALRFSAYFRLRDELLEDAREMGRCGKVRLVETPGTNAPLAFGVIDKVIALPDGFLAQPDRVVRDLALDHELEHHKGQDLLVNILVQPLFAIHWWNPLSRYGWLALRRDQEAACDARVMASAKREEREVYANLIVSFAAKDALGHAASPAHALTAPMACPVLGEKSIIHRLRSLNMENTNRKQRAIGSLMLGAGLVALPLTASISYAASEAPAPPAPPTAPDMTAIVPAPPVPPAPPTPPAVPLPPEAPTTAMAGEQIFAIDPDADAWPSSAKEPDVFVIEDERNGSDRRFIVRTNNRSAHFIDRAQLGEEGQLSEAQMDEIMEEVREGLKEANRVLENVPQMIETAMAEVEVEMEREGRTRVRVERGCDDTGTEVATTTELGDGSQVVKICQKRIMSTALQGLREAREEIRNNQEISKEARKSALREIDRTIDRWADTSS